MVKTYEPCIKTKLNLYSYALVFDVLMLFNLAPKMEFQNLETAIRCLHIKLICEFHHVVYLHFNKFQISSYGCSLYILMKNFTNYIFVLPDLLSFKLKVENTLERYFCSVFLMLYNIYKRKLFTIVLETTKESILLLFRLKIIYFIYWNLYRNIYAHKMKIWILFRNESVSIFFLDIKIYWKF